MKLLVGIDSSQASSAVVDEVAMRPWPSETTACVIHIIDWSQSPSSDSLVQAIRQSADVLIKSASDKLGKAGLQCETRVLDGHPRLALAKYAKEWGADLVVVGSHGAGGLARFLLGSVAQAALRRSPCSVEIVRKPVLGAASTSVPMKILLAVDGSDCSMAAVRSVAKRPWPPKSLMRVISVVPLSVPFAETISLPATLVYPIPNLLDDIEKHARGQAQEAVERSRHILRKAGIQAIDTDCFPVGDARQVILDQAKDWGADLIVVGSHGYRGVDRFMLGSVSESVAMHAQCSVEVIRK
jgi:nucleotide-binding universal stress UspA family protein